MSRQTPGDVSPNQYSPDGRWYWDGTRWLAVPVGEPPLKPGSQPAGGIGNPAWAPPPPVPVPVEQAPPQPAPVPAPAPAASPAAKRLPSFLIPVAIVLVALVVLGGAGTGALIAIRNHQTTSIPASAPSAQAIFQMPYTKGVRSARFHEVEHAGGSTFNGSGVIEFGPSHAFSESLSGKYGVFQRVVQVGGVTYEADIGGSYRATDTEPLQFSLLGWDGRPPLDPMRLTSQTVVAGQQAWVLKEAHSSTEWIIGERTGDPLEAILDGHDVFTFSDWGKAPQIKAPAPVSTSRYSGSGSGPVVAPAATVTVLNEQVDAAASNGDPTGFQHVALEISYENTAASASDFDNILTLVSSDGVFADATFSSLSPSFKSGTGVSPGQTITGWDDFMVPKQSSGFHLLFGEQGDQMQTLDYLISIQVPAPR